MGSGYEAKRSHHLHDETTDPTIDSQIVASQHIVF